MRSVHNPCPPLVLALAGAALAGWFPLAGASSSLGAEEAAAPQSAPADKKAEPAAPTPPAGDKFDPLRLPGDFVILVSDKLTEALRMAPDHIVIRKDVWQEKMAELACLQEQVKPKAVRSPSHCHLKGKVEGNAALLTVQFDFPTDRPDALVTLACVQGLATNVSLDDGRTPLLRPDADGFLVQVDKPGAHKLTLEILVPLISRGTGQSLELSLPRAPITTLDLELPPGVRDVRVAGKPREETLVNLIRGNTLSGPLGTAEKLDLSWKGPRAAPGAPLLAAESLVLVRLDANRSTASAELTLRAEAGQTDVWRLLVPKGSEVRVVPAADAARLAGPIQTADQSVGSLRTLRLREPSAEPLKVYVTAPPGPALTPTGIVTVGPFAVPGAARHSGSVLVSSTLTDLQPDCQPHAGMQAIDLLPRNLTEDETRKDSTLVAAFRYGNVSAAEGFPAAGAGLGPWLDIRAGLAHGHLRTQVNHLLALQPDAASRELVWQSHTTILATPRWPSVDQVKVQLPDGWEPADDFDAVPAGMPRVVVLRLARGTRDAVSGQVTLTLRGRYSDKQKREGSATLGLPRPLGTIDQGGDLTVQVGPDLEVLPGASAGLEVLRQSPHEQVWRCRNLPEALAVSWRPYVPDVRVHSVADVDLALRGGHVRQVIHLQLPPPPPARVVLRVPAGVIGLRVTRGGTLTPSPPTPLPQGGEGRKKESPSPPEGGRGVGGEGATATARQVTLDKSSDGEHRLVLEYDCTALGRAGDAAPFQVPLVYPESMTQGDARVRLWCPAGMLPVLLDGTPWLVQPIEDVKDRKTLPALVARAPRADAPLPLRWGEPQEAFPVLAERALVRVRVAEDGSQRCEARYRLRQLAAPQLDVELPAPAAILGLEAKLDGKPVAHEVLDDAGQPSDGGRLVRLRLAPELVKPGSVLELSYSLPPGRAGSGGWGGGTLTTPLPAPILRGDAGVVPTCWEVRVPPSWVVLGPESGPGVERTWGRRGWLLALRLARVPAEQDRDLTGGNPSGDGSEPPAVVCWRNSPEALTLTHVPQKAWLLACSLALVVIGLVLYGLGRPATRDGPPNRGLAGILVLLALAAAAGAVFQPTVLAALAYGCEPGAVVLLVVGLLRWLLHERYRRQVVFLPSFSRGRSGSSMLRGSNVSRPPGEPSTVDAPRPAASSASK
jgi:hypothetical protein